MIDLQAVLDHLPQGVSVFDHELRLRLWNRRLLDVLEMPAEALYDGAPFEELLMIPARRGEYGPGDPYELVMQRKALALKFLPHRFERTRPNGRTHLVEGQPILRDGRVVGFVSSYTEITDRKDAELALQARHDMLRTLVDNIPSGITVFDAELRMVLHNDQVLELVDLPRDFAASQPHFDEVIRHNARRGEYGEVDVEARVAELTALARQPVPHAVERTRPNGRVLEVRGAPLPGGGFVSIYTDITEQRRRSAYLQAILEQLPHAVSVFDEDLRLKHWNQHLPEVLALPPQALQEDARLDDLLRIAARLGDDGPGEVDELVSRRPELALRFEPHRFTRTGAHGRTHLVEGRPMTVDGALAGVITTYTDITEQTQIEHELRTRNAVFGKLIDNIPGGVSLFDAQFHLVAANDRFQTLLGFPDRLLAREPVTLESLFRFNAERGEYGPCDVQAKVGELMARARQREPHVFERSRPDGTVLEIRGLPLPDGGFVTIYTDVTEHKRAIEAIERLAHRDALTGLDNRYTLESRLDQCIADARRTTRALAVLFIDMDHFKAINDSLGHATGDEFLTVIATRLRAQCRESDIVARLGGDEFVLVLTNIADAAASIGMVAEMLDSLAEPMELGSQQVTPSASVGIALFPQDGQDRSTLMKHADMAMYAAKDAGRAGYRFFDAAMTRTADERLRMEADLRRALRAGEFELHFQPKINADTMAVAGFEALIRWRRPDGELVLPGRFIPLAEETGLIADIGEWVLRQACRTLHGWRAQGLKELPISVNLSVRELRNPKLVEQVRQALADHAVEGRWLEFEITESVAMDDAERTVVLLRALKELGIGLSIDDFGTGYSSLAYLKRLPLDHLKLDRTFVTDIETDPNDAAICAATIRLAHTLGLGVVAEGVETDAQATYLRGLACDLMQGYRFGYPVPEPEARALVRPGLLSSS